MLQPGLLRPARSVRPGRSRWYAIGTLVLASVLLYLAVRGVDLTQVVDVLRRSRIDLLLAACMVLSVSYFVRGLRWRILLSAERWLPPIQVFAGTMVGYLGNNFLPARAGELVRTVLLGRSADLSSGFILGTIFTERLIDVVAVVVLGGGALLSLESLMPAWMPDAVRGVGVAGLIVVAGLVLTVRGQNVIQQVLSRLPLSDTIRSRVVALLRNFTSGVQAFRSTRRGLHLIGLTIVVWLLDSIVVMIVAQALALSLALPEALFFVAALALSSAIPSTPGYVGVYQFVAVTVLAPFGFSPSEALAHIIAFQAVAYAAVTVWGLWGLWRLGAGKPQRAPSTQRD